MLTFATRTRFALSKISPPVWRILLHSALLGLAGSIADLLFNFYLVSMGYETDVAGLLSMVNRVAGVALGLPIGLLIDRAGARRALLAGAACYTLGWALLLTSGALWVLIATQFLIGAALILAQTAIVPLMTLVTSEAQRPTVFGLNAAAATMIGLAGSLIGGLLPASAGLLLDVSPQSAPAYRLALLSVVALSATCLLPILGGFRKLSHADPAATLAEREPPRRSLRTLLRYASPSLLLGFGGGLILPFQNLFFRREFGLSDPQVGAVLAAAALGMGLGALLGGPANARFGLQRAAAWMRIFAAPAMLLMLLPALAPATAGFFLRGLFVAASYPLNDALVMQLTPPRQRGLAVSLTSIGWSLGWALASAASGWAQLRWGFGPALLAAAISYAVSGALIATLRVDRPD